MHSPWTLSPLGVLSRSAAHLSHLARLRSIYRIAIFRGLVSHPWACSVLFMNDSLHSRNRLGKSRHIRWGQRRHFLFTSLYFSAGGNSFPESHFFLVFLAELGHMPTPDQFLAKRNRNALISLNHETLPGAVCCHLKHIRIPLPSRKEGMAWGRQLIGSAAFMHPHND